MRLRNNPNAQQELNASPKVRKAFPIKLTKNTIIELGMGKGEMLTQLAINNPDKEYIGIEKYPTAALKALKRIEKAELKNIFIICDDIKNLNSFFIGKVATIWLTFSDPWPKNRHEKRRLTHKFFLDKYKLILSSPGKIKLKTDNDQFFEYSLESMQEYGMNIIALSRDFHHSKFMENNAMTGYEKKWSETGKKINYLEAVFK